MEPSDRRVLNEAVDGLRADVRALVEHLASVRNASDRVTAAGAAMEAMEQEATRLQDVRLAAIAELRSTGHSYERIASLTGLSKARVAQLSRAALRR